MSGVDLAAAVLKVRPTTPVLLMTGYSGDWTHEMVRQAGIRDILNKPITAADQVLNVMGFEALARDALPPAHFGYLATGADDDHTVVRNQDAFSHYEIRSRRFVDVSHIDTARDVFGTAWPTPESAPSAQGTHVHWAGRV